MGILTAMPLAKLGSLQPEVYTCLSNIASRSEINLRVRDICRKHPPIRDAYGTKTLELAQQEWRDVDEYCDDKNDVLAWVLEKAGLSDEEREQIRQLNK